MDKNIIENRLINEKNGKYSILSSSYNGWNKPHNFICNIHNEEFTCTPKELFAKSSNKICKQCLAEKKLLKKQKELLEKDKQFKEKLFNKFNGSIETNDNYKGNRNKMNFVCKICGFKWISTPESILANNGCRACSSRNSAKRYSTEEIQEKLDAKYGYKKYILQEDYINSDTPINVLHSDCGNISKIRPGSLLFKDRKYCSKCANFHKDKSFKEELEEIDNSYKLLSEYINNKTKVKLLHLTCNNEFMMTPNDFLSGYRCPHCGGTKKKSFEEFREQVESIENGRFSLLSNIYTNNKDKYEFFDNINNEKITMAGKDFLMKYSNNKLGKEGNGLSEEEFLEKIYSIPTNKEFILNEQYLNSNHPISYKHACGEIISYNTSRSDQIIICPKCHNKYSAGETQIINFLEKNNIVFEKEKMFETCKCKRNLRFDFYIENKKLLIEFDGEQHYTGWKRDKEDLKEIQKRDNIKNEWVKNHKEYKLIRIKYDQDINYILKEIFINNNYNIDNLFTINI